MRRAQLPFPSGTETSYYGDVSLQTMDNSTENCSARRTESVDAAAIAALIKRSTESVFGRINVDYIM